MTKRKRYSKEFEEYLSKQPNVRKTNTSNIVDTFTESDWERIAADARRYSEKPQTQDNVSIDWSKNGY